MISQCKHISIPNPVKKNTVLKNKAEGNLATNDIFTPKPFY